MSTKPGWRGRFFEDFEVGDVYEHSLGRTVTRPGSTGQSDFFTEVLRILN